MWPVAVSEQHVAAARGPDCLLLLHSGHWPQPIVMLSACGHQQYWQAIIQIFWIAPGAAVIQGVTKLLEGVKSL